MDLKSTIVRLSGVLTPLTSASPLAAVVDCICHHDAMVLQTATMRHRLKLTHVDINERTNADGRLPVGMAKWRNGKRPKGVASGMRPATDALIETDILSNIRHECMQVTVGLVESLKTTGSGYGFESAVGDLVAVSYVVLIKLMICTRISSTFPLLSPRRCRPCP